MSSPEVKFILPLPLLKKDKDKKLIVQQPCPQTHPLSSSCRGGPNTTEYCAPGYTSYLCVPCASTHYASNGKCIECSMNAASATTLAMVAVLGVLVVFFVLFVAKRMREKASDSMMNRVKILISFAQIIYGMPALFSFSFPTNYTTFLAAFISIMSLSFLSEIGGFNCLVATNYYSKLMTVTLVPLIIILAIGLAYVRLENPDVSLSTVFNRSESTARSVEELRVLREAFDAIDTDGGGTIDTEEL